MRRSRPDFPNGCNTIRPPIRSLQNYRFSLQCQVSNSTSRAHRSAHPGCNANSQSTNRATTMNVEADAVAERVMRMPDPRTIAMMQHKKWAASEFGDRFSATNVNRFFVVQKWSPFWSPFIAEGAPKLLSGSSLVIENTTTPYFEFRLFNRRGASLSEASLLAQYDCG